MSRFDDGRWSRILIWTGAALAWGTAFISTWLEPTRAMDAVELAPVASDTSELAAQASMPRPASQGLVILRFTPVTAPAAEVLTVRVERPGGDAAAVSAQPAPAPESSGS